MKHLISVFCVLVLAVAPACESDGDSSSGTSGSGNTGSLWSTGLDESLSLSELTDEQQISACEVGGEFFANWEAENAENIKRAHCYMSVSFSAQFSADFPELDAPQFDCQERYDQCIAGEGTFAEDPEEDAEEEPEACEDQLEDFSECTEATVAELETCSLARLEIMESGYEILAAGTCEDIAASAQSEGPDDLMAGIPSMDDVPECIEVEEKCAALQLNGETQDRGPGDEDDGPPPTDPVPSDS